MATQADYRMILGIQPQQNPWAEALRVLPGAVTQGLGIADYFRERGRESQLQKLMQGAFDPVTGQMDEAKVMDAVMQTYPEKAPALMSEMRKSAQFQQGQQALQDYMRLSSGGGGATGGGGLSLPADIQAGLAMGAGGDPYQGITNIAQERAKLYMKQLEFNNQLVPGLDEMGRPVTRTREQWQAGTAPQTPVGAPETPVGAPAPVGAPGASGAPVAAPATSQSTNYESTANDLLGRLVTAESGGQHYGQGGGLLTSPKGAQGITQVMPATGKEPGFGVTPVQNSSQQEYLRFGRDYLTAMLNEFNGDPRKAFAAYNAGPGYVQDAVQQRGAGWEGALPQETKAYLQKTLGPLGGSAQVAPAPAAPAPAAPAPSRPGDIRTGLSEPEKQVFEIEKERREQIYRMQAEERQRREQIAKEQRAADTKIAEEKRNLEFAGLQEGDKAWFRDVYSPALKEYSANENIIGDLNSMERLIKEGKTGPGSEFWLTLKGYLVAGGIIDPKAVVNEQEIISLSNSLTWNTLNKVPGVTTDMDFQRMQMSWPNIQSAGEANQFIIDSKKAVLKRRQQQIEFYRKNYKGALSSGNLSGLDEAWQQTPTMQRSVWDEPIMAKWKLKYPLSGEQEGGAVPPNGVIKFNHPQQAEIDKIKADIKAGLIRGQQ